MEQKRRNYNGIFFISLLILSITIGHSQTIKVSKAISTLPRLSVSKQNPHFFVTKGEKPFFWLADTGWLLFSKLKREEAVQYLEDRKQKGFNVIQVMVLHSLDGLNVYGDAAILDRDVSKPIVTPGIDFRNEAEYDYWDHVDFIIQTAAEKGIYMA